MRPKRADGSIVLHTWGLVADRSDKQVIMFNMTRAEAERIASENPGQLLAQPICTRHYTPRGRVRE